MIWNTYSYITYIYICIITIGETCTRWDNNNIRRVTLFKERATEFVIILDRLIVISYALHYALENRRGKQQTKSLQDNNNYLILRAERDGHAFSGPDLVRNCKTA